MSVYDEFNERMSVGAKEWAKIINSIVLPALCGGGVVFVICLIIAVIKTLITGE